MVLFNGKCRVGTYHPTSVAICTLSPWRELGYAFMRCEEEVRIKQDFERHVNKKGTKLLAISHVKY